MSETNDPRQATGDEGGVAFPEADRLFTAFRKQKARRVYRLWWLVPPLVLAVGAWAMTRTFVPTLRVVTLKGIFTVYPGMTHPEVVKVLGNPIALERGPDGQQDCYQYGTPSLEEPGFLMYTLCYEGGRLRDMRVRRYSTWQVDSEGAFLPPMADGR